ncbi:MAG: hypothetical protein QM770_00795 [Tepidisphaeraceae bacterium]
MTLGTALQNVNESFERIHPLPTEPAVHRWDQAIRRAERVIHNWTPTASGMGLWLCEVHRFDSLVNQITTAANALQSAVVHAFCHGLHPTLANAIDDLVVSIESQTIELDQFLQQQAHASVQ